MCNKKGRIKCTQEMFYRNYKKVNENINKLYRNDQLLRILEAKIYIVKLVRCFFFNLLVIWEV